MEDLKVYSRPSAPSLNVTPHALRPGPESQADTGKNQPEVGQAEAELAIEMLKQTASEQEIDLNFSVHKASGRTMIKVVEAETHKTVREIPPEEILNMIANIEEMSGQLLSTKI